MEHIRDNTARIGQRRGSEGASEEPKDDQRLNVLGTCAASIKRSQSTVRAYEEQLSTEQFGQRGPE